MNFQDILQSTLETARKPFFNWGIHETKGRGLSPLKGSPFPYFENPVDVKLNELLEERAKKAKAQREIAEPTPEPLPSPTAIPTPTPDVGRNFIYDYDPYLEGLTEDQIAKLNLKQPNDIMHEVYQSHFPEDATRAAIVSRTEGGGAIEPKPFVNPVGKLAGSTDVGPMMINAGVAQSGKPTTFDDLMNRFPTQMEQAGVVPGDHPEYPGVNESIFDPHVNAAVAKINFDDPGNKQGWWGRWFGPRNYGLNKEDFISRESPY